MRNTPLLGTVTVLTFVLAYQVSGAEPAASSAAQSQTVYPAGTADETNSIALTSSPGSANRLEAEPEIGLHKGLNEAGIALGGSIGSRIFGGRQMHDFALERLYVGRIVTDDLGGDGWYRGDFELFAEAIGGEQFKPRAAGFGGVTAMLRYNFDTGKRWLPFYDIGAGLTATDIGSPDLSGTFEFNLQTGPGVRWMLTQNTALTLQCRYLHISDAGIDTPNRGVNTWSFYAGVSWLF